MTELDLVHGLLVLSLAVAPFGTYGFSHAPWRWQIVFHAGAFCCTALGLLLAVPELCFAWPLFCAGIFTHFLRHRAPYLGSPYELCKCIPFMFSMVAAAWLVGGANELYLLGYGAQFSYYAALHGNVLGWMIVGGLATLAGQAGPDRRLHLTSVFVCFGSFVVVAVGIDAWSAIKPIGVVGLSVMIPASQVAFLRRVRGRNNPAFVLGCISLFCFLLTLALAWLNELSRLPRADLGGIRIMVWFHGVLNAAVVAPSFLAAVALLRSSTSSLPAVKSAG